METLLSRLDAVREELLTLYESGSNRLEDQIRHWKLLRKEYVMLHFARKHDIYRLGLSSVPTLQVSQAKAKEAIRMELLLESLAKSEYSSEPWTLSETSIEMLETPPKDCFKKHGVTVEVLFDGDPENVMTYTNWKDIYYQTESGWEKTTGHVNYDGCFYYEGRSQVYFVRFAPDAARYGSTGEWEVRYQNDVFFPVASVSSTSEWCPPSTGSGIQPWGDKLPVDTCLGSAGRPAQTARRSPDSSGSSATSTTTSRRRRKSVRIRKATAPQEAQRSSPRSSSGAEDGRQARFQPGGRIPPGSHQQVERGARENPRRRRSRLIQLLADAADPPIAVLRGASNSLKCLRYRLNRRHRGLFNHISTTWSWADERGPGANARMIIAFTNSTQRQTFLDTVSLPRPITYFLGNFSSL
ncbi:E2 protein [Bos taurus papillomavirus 18]|uniref:Regulatory protein E2 n=1 Tax=Bos taurus papillomavirus 18 TaxID=1887216 RepID=A0A1B2K208_9PAPI|nr:E2 protein [Bos taurus papillomavirus 18]ANZ90247.1 E2 protein [Bos taurus papillomavirus 18]